MVSASTLSLCSHSKINYQSRRKHRHEPWGVNSPKPRIFFHNARGFISPFSLVSIAPKAAPLNQFRFRAAAAGAPDSGSSKSRRGESCPRVYTQSQAQSPVAPVTEIASEGIKAFDGILQSNVALKTLTLPAPSSILLKRNRNCERLICRAEKEYKFPNPIPQFADSETEKFQIHMKNKLSKKDMFGDSVDQVVTLCSEKLNEFLHTDYGGPGTLLVNPFIDMADAINEKGLPGGPQAARAAVKWAQAHIDKDWEEWTATPTQDH